MGEKQRLYQMDYGQQKDIAAFFPPPPAWVDQVSITGGTSATYTIPSGAIYLIISAEANVDFYITVDDDAVVPAAGITDGSGSFANMSQLNVRDVTSLGIISSDTTILTIAAYL